MISERKWFEYYVGYDYITPMSVKGRKVTNLDEGLCWVYLQDGENFSMFIGLAEGFRGERLQEKMIIGGGARLWKMWEAAKCV